MRKVSNNDLERVYGSQMGSLVTRFHTIVFWFEAIIRKKHDDPSVNQYLKNHFVKLVADETETE